MLAAEEGMLLLMFGCFIGPAKYDDRVDRLSGDDTDDR